MRHFGRLFVLVIVSALVLGGDNRKRDSVCGSCNGHGTCNVTSAQCVCDQGYDPVGNCSYSIVMPAPLDTSITATASGYGGSPPNNFAPWNLIYGNATWNAHGYPPQYILFSLDQPYEWYSNDQYLAIVLSQNPSCNTTTNVYAGLTSADTLIANFTNLFTKNEDVLTVYGANLTVSGPFQFQYLKIEQTQSLSWTSFESIKLVATPSLGTTTITSTSSTTTSLASTSLASTSSTSTTTASASTSLASTSATSTSSTSVASTSATSSNYASTSATSTNVASTSATSTHQATTSTTSASLASTSSISTNSATTSAASTSVASTSSTSAHASTSSTTTAASTSVASTLATSTHATSTSATASTLLASTSASTNAASTSASSTASTSTIALTSTESATSLASTLVTSTSLTSTSIATSLAPTSLTSTLSSSTTGAVCGNGIVENGEDCDSNSTCCANCKWAPASTLCRNASGSCDVADYCTGINTACPDNRLPPNYVCRNSTKECDIPEVCGFNADCPPDIIKPLDTCGVCGGDNTSCVPGEGVCGDGKCFGIETCTNCVLDCGSCDKECTLPCVHGDCSNGLCLCTGNFSGPSCNQESEPVDVQANTTSPAVAISSTHAVFSISVSEIREISGATGDVVKAYNLQTSNIVLNTSILNGVRVFSYPIMFDNSASLVINFFQIINTTKFDFANQTFTLQPDAVKVTMEIYSWPFQTIKSQLQVFINIVVQNSRQYMCKVQNVNSDDSGSTRAIDFYIDGISFYGKFLDTAVVDQVSKPTIVGHEGNIVVLTLPHFWDYAALDPDFSVLVAGNIPDSCGSKSTNTGGISISAVIGGVAIGAAVVGTVLAARRKHRTRAKLAMHDNL